MDEPSLLSTSESDQPIRLAYRLLPGGRTRAIRVVPSRTQDSPPLSESEVRSLQSRLHALDVAVVRELRAGSMFGHLGDAQVARLLPLLAQRRTLWNDRPLIIEEEPLRPRVQIEAEEGGEMHLTLGLTDADGTWQALSGGRLVAGAQAFFLRDGRAVPVESPKPWELGTWAASATIPLGSALTPQDRDRIVRDLASAGVPQSDLMMLAVRRGPPSRLVARIWALEGAHGEPQAGLILEADYPGGRAVIVNQRPASPYLVCSDGAGLVERDLMAEEGARRALRETGFKFDRASGTFLAKGETALQLLDPHGDLLPEYWTIERSADIPLFRRDLDLNAKVTLREEEGLLDLEVDVQTVGDIASDDAMAEALVEMKDLLGWLRSKKRYLRLQDGSYVAPSKRFRSGLRVLAELGAEKKRVLVSPLCIGLLRMIGDHAGLAAADAATAAWLEELSSEGGPRTEPPPAALEGVMRDYQRRGLDWLSMLHRHRLTGILADDMGLGKTLQTLAMLLVAREKEGQKPSLVVAPTSVISVWRDEAARFTPSVKLVLFHGPPALRKEIDITGADLVVTSYGVLRREAERLGAVAFRYVILDEAQAAKNASSQNAKAVRMLKSERRLALTGTPLENRTEELWATFDFLAPGFLGNLRQFRKRYAKPISHGDNEALAMLRGRVQPLILRRMKSEVAKELPPKIESVVRCEMGASQRALYDHTAGRLRETVMQKIEKVGIERVQLDILAALTRLRQICCDPSLIAGKTDVKAPPSAKLALFEELIREALASERRIVVFSQFVQMQKRLIAVIRKLGVEPAWLHGGTRKRDKVVASFQDPNGPPIIVVSLRAGGTGVTLTRADTVMHYDPWWNPAVEQQATDRTHRLGQTQKVCVYKLVCAGSIEERVLALAARKDALAEKIISSDGETGAKQITVNDVLGLLQ